MGNLKKKRTTQQYEIDEMTKRFKFFVALVLSLGIGFSPVSFASDDDDEREDDSRPVLSYPYFTDFEKPAHKKDVEDDDDKAEADDDDYTLRNPKRDWRTQGFWSISRDRDDRTSFSGKRHLDNNPKEKTLKGGKRENNRQQTAELKRNILIPADSKNPILSFWHRLELGANDSVEVQIRFKVTHARKKDREWMTLRTYTAVDNTAGYKQQIFPLGVYKGEAIRIRFVQTVGDTVNTWLIDDVLIGESADQDGDGIPDSEDADRDGDGISNDYEIQAGTNPDDPASAPSDIDNDGIPDVLDADIDGDGVANGQDAFPQDPTESVDSDGDGIGNNADTDDDNDGIQDDYEIQLGTDPLDPASEPADQDNDGIPDALDTDRDGDGIADAEDAFPDNAAEWSDLDNDGIGDNSDPDRDGDGFSNDIEAQFATDPKDATSTPPDLDGDKIPDAIDDDRDGDGVGNDQDLFPDNGSEWADLDVDGIGDNSDPDRDGDGVNNTYELELGFDPNNAASVPPDMDGDGIPDTLDGDIDGDGVANEGDAFPNDPAEWTDTDGDGTGDNTDTDRDGDGYTNDIEELFNSDPLDAASTPPDLDSDLIPDLLDDDRDGDGFLNTADAFPDDPTEWADMDADHIGDNGDPDRDGDGINNDLDLFPNDGTEWADLDNDGIGDNADVDRDGDGANNDVDVFPNDPTETADLDNDGVGDNTDPDRDNDGVNNNVDAFPIDPTESSDIDGDGTGDNADTDRDNDGYLNDADKFPNDPNEWADLDNDGIGDNSDTDRDGDGHLNDEDVFPDDPTQWKLPVLIIDTPATLSTLGASPVRVAGSIDDPNATLTVNGVPVSHSGGAWQINVALEEGHNTIVARAVDARGNEVTAVVSVSLDTTPPYVTIENPADGKTVYEPTVAVTGLINDIVRGTVSEDQAVVSVNGVAATVSNRSYLAENVALIEGDNTITVSASDNVGNTSTASVTIKYVVPHGKQIDLVSGQNQSAKIRNVLPKPLLVKLTDELSQPVADKQVVFRVVQGDGVLGAGTDGEGQGVIATTDANGIASTTFKLGSRAGQGNNQVRVKAVGFEGEVLFYASAQANPGNKVSINSGNNQRGAVNQPLPLPLVVAVTDEGANYVAGSQVEFSVTAGSGKFQNGEKTIVSTTDSDGRASAHFVLGSEAGMDIHRVTAKLVGTELNAGFTASALKPADPGQTTITGVVLDNQDKPLPGVTIRVDGTTRQAVTDAQGQFKILQAPVGPVHLVADGSTTTAGGEYPTLSYNLVTVAGADNPLSAPIYMVKLDTENAVWVGREDAELTLAEVPGFKLKVKAASVTFPDGAKEGFLSVTPVNASKVPMAPPNGMQPQFIVTIQPAGAKFDPPAQLTLPNVDGHAPGAEVEMFSYDHDLEEFVSIGLGTVSVDGSIVESNSGVGVIKAGWHCGTPPGSSACAHNCPVCKKCPADCSGCFPDDSQDAGECMKCEGGDPKPIRVTSATAQVEGASRYVTNLKRPDGGGVVPPLLFDATSITERCDNVQYSWDFADGGTADSREARHAYTSEGSFVAKLTATCSECDSASATSEVTVDVVKVDVIEILDSASTNSIEIPGHNNWPFDPKAIDVTNPDVAPGKHHAVFFKEVVTPDFRVDDFYVNLIPHLTPDHVRETELPYVRWTRYAGPHSGEFLNTETLRNAKLNNPKIGGVYQFRLDIGGGSADPNEVNIVLPLAGAEVENIIRTDVDRAFAFASRVNAKYDIATRVFLASNGTWFWNAGAGDYVGRPDNAASPTVRLYNPVQDPVGENAGNAGLGAVATWEGIPTRLSKASNMLVALAMDAVGVPDPLLTLANYFGTSNSPAADVAWDAGVQISRGTSYDAVVPSMVKSIFYLEPNDKNRKLWPNPNYADNYVDGGVPIDWNNKFRSPGFLFLEND